jgi:LDH2 family malate/lactate/ureidoglycolate dehydrogenase
MSDPVRLALAEVHALTLQVLRAHGVSEAHARAMADTITAAARDACPAHGLFRLPGYVSAVRSGTVTPDAVPEVPELAPAIVHVDGQHGFAPLALQIGRAPLAAKAR